MNTPSIKTQTPKDAARQFSSSMIEQGFVPEALHAYKDTDGEIIYWRIRCKHPDGRKWIRPMYCDKNDQYHLEEPPALKDEPKPLYGLHLLAQHPNARVIISEGEYPADVLNKFLQTQNEKDSYITITSGGATSAEKANWSPLIGRACLVWPDADDAGLGYTNTVVTILLSLGCHAQIIDSKKLGLVGKEDCVDWLAKNPEATKIHIEQLPLVNSLDLKDAAPNHENNQASNPNKSSSLLIALVEEAEFFHDEQKQSYANFTNKNHTETWPLDSENFRAWLSHKFWEKYKKPIGENALKEAISVMQGKAKYEGKCHKVFSRIGYLENKIYINIGNENWQVIEISPDGWSILDKSPIKFRGISHMKAMPLPISGGKIDLLWKYVNISESDRKLVIAWLLDCWLPTTNFPVLILTGVHGSAKSSSQEILRSLVDPSTCNSRNAPKNQDDIVIAAANNWVVSYNNVSKLTQQNQDDLCCLSTGGGFARRRLYTTEEEAVIDIRRPIILNGINNPITAQDLISRSIVLEMAPIEETKRKSDSELKKEFKNDYPEILGGLLDIFTKTLAIIPNVALSKKPRMADFAVLGTALEQILGWEKGSFLRDYDENYKENMNSALESSPVIMALINFMQTRSKYKDNFARLLEELSLLAPNISVGWPKSGKGLSNILKRQAPALEALGIKIYFDGSRRNDGYHVEILNEQNAYKESKG